MEGKAGPPDQQVMTEIPQPIALNACRCSPPTSPPAHQLMSASSYLVFSSACAMLHCVAPICLHRRVATRLPSLRYRCTQTRQQYSRVTSKQPAVLKIM